MKEIGAHFGISHARVGQILQFFGYTKKDGGIFAVRQKRGPYYKRFLEQWARARQRGIGWELTFDEWMEIWDASGKIDLRGVKAGHYVMARKGDIGPYSKENVFICRHEQNISDGHKKILPLGQPAIQL